MAEPEGSMVRGASDTRRSAPGGERPVKRARALVLKDNPKNPQFVEKLAYRVLSLVMVWCSS